jgi:hypothetical protein
MKRHVATQPIYQVIGSDGRAFGPFVSETRAAFFATVRWPDQQRGEGWSIRPIGRRGQQDDDDEA